MQSQKNNIIHQCICVLLQKHKGFSLQAATYPWTQLTKALEHSSNTVQLMTATAVCSLQISGSYSCIMRLVIYCYRDWRDTERNLNLGVSFQKHCKGRLYCASQEKLSPKHEDGLGALPPLGSPREFTPVPGYSTQELCMKKQISSRGNFCLLECSPIIPFYGPRGLGMLHSQETGRD